MSFEKIFVVKETNKITIIGSGYEPSGAGPKYDHDCYIVRPDFDIVWWPVLWKRNTEYRIFPVKMLDKIYQLRKKRTKTVAILWEQGIDITPEVGKILCGE